MEGVGAGVGAGVIVAVEASDVELVESTDEVAGQVFGSSGNEGWAKVADDEDVIEGVFEEDSSVFSVRIGTVGPGSTVMVIVRILKGRLDLPVKIEQ